MYDFLRYQKRCRFSAYMLEQFYFPATIILVLKLIVQSNHKKTSYICVTKGQIIGCEIEVREIVYF